MAQLTKYATAQGLFTKVSMTMPANSPGILAQQEYLQVVAYLLLQNFYVAPDRILTFSNLISIPLGTG